MFNFKTSRKMKKEITVQEWLQILAKVAGQVAACLKDGKITLEEALSLTVQVITDIVNAYNN